MQGFSRVPHNARTAALFGDILRIHQAIPKVARDWDQLVAQADGTEQCLKLLIREVKMLDYENEALRERLKQESISIEFTWPRVPTDDEIVSRSIEYLAAGATR